MQDPRLNGSVFNKCDMLRMIKVAEKCTSEDPNERPYMPVVGVLQLIITSLQLVLRICLSITHSDRSEDVTLALMEV